MDKNLDKEVNKEGRIERIKRNIRENRKTYIGSSIGFIVGAIGTAMFITLKYGMTEKDMTEKFVAEIVNRIKGNRNTITQRIKYQAISIYGNKIGRPGIPVIDMTTGKKFESETLAAEFAGVSVSMMSNHLNGKRDHINGGQFKRV